MSTIPRSTDPAPRPPRNLSATLQGQPAAPPADVLERVGPGDRIVILSAAAGAGHMMAAAALEAALRRYVPQADVRVVDVLEITSRFFRGLYAGGYLALVNHAPTVMGWLYELFDQPEGRGTERVRAWFQSINTRPVERLLAARPPRLILNTHFLSAEIVARLRRGGLTCPHATVVTDLEAHRLWVQRPTERYYCATDEAKDGLVALGVPLDDVQVTGIPVRRTFTELPTRAAACAAHRLDPARPVVLLMCGGFGVGPTQRLFEELLALPGEIQIVTVTGRNAALQQRLSGIAARHARPVRVLGYTDRMHELMCAADALVSKPGGLTTAEALVCGTPLVIVNPIPGHESRNSDVLLERGAAVKVNSPRLLSYRLRRLLDDRPRLERLRTVAGELGRPHAADQIAGDALSLLTPLVV